MSLRLKRKSNGRAAVFVTRFQRGEPICHHMTRRARWHKYIGGHAIS
jgi:hypothetical protein